MSADNAPRQILSGLGLERLRDELSGRDVAIVGQVAELRLLSAAQVRAVHFTADEHKTEEAAGRACQRAMTRLVEARLLVRLERRVGGARAGSASYIYAIGPVGQRLVMNGKPRQRFYEPTARFVDHTLAIAQLVVDFIGLSRAGKADILQMQAEPRCYRQWMAAQGVVVLKPDLFVALGIGDLEFRWFVEVDLGTESLPVLQRKCLIYERYYQSGKEQAAHGVFPRVCWVLPTERRAEQLRREIDRDGRLTDKLFTVSTTDVALDVLRGGAS